LTEFWGLLKAWGDTDGTLQFGWILVPILLALLTRLDLSKGIRAFMAVVSLLMPLAIPLLLPTSRPFGTLDWVIISVGFICVALGLARSHYRQVGSSVKAFYDHFNETETGSKPKKNKTETGSKPKKEELVAEGASSFKVLIYGIYGLAGLLGSIVSYFYIGVTRTPQGFVFQNNEGFIAALSLLIIVLAGAAVPIYTDLAKKVRAEIDLYESQVSSLQQASTNVDHHANFLWTHFERVARSTIVEWSRTTTIRDIAEASHLMLFMPFLAIRGLRQAGRPNATFVNSRDEVFKPFLNMRLQQFDYADPPDRRMHGAQEHYFTCAADWSSLKRAGLFLHPGTDFKDPNTGRNVTEDRLTVGDRRHRSRRLTYLGWSLQGDLARAKARYGDERILAPEEPGGSISFWPALAGNVTTSWEFENSTQFLLPATEEFFVALLQQRYEAEYSRAPTPNSADTTTPIHEFQREFRRRADRHIRRYSDPDNSQVSGSIMQTLAEQGDLLDFDVSSLSDDFSLFYHLFVATRDGMNQGADARFLYYAFWLIALITSETRVSLILNQFENAEIDGDGEPREQLESRFEHLGNHFNAKRITEALRSGGVRLNGAEEEFLLLSLADHKSALYNWLRAAKSATTRRRLRSYESKLDNLSFGKQLGIEILPSRAGRIQHLRRFLGVSEAQKPLTVRSIFDLLPVQSATTVRALRIQQFAQDSYRDYRRVVDDLSISNSFSAAVAISNVNMRNVAEMVTTREEIAAEAAELNQRMNQFLDWISRCLSDGQDPEPLAGLIQLTRDDGYRLIAKALWLVSPVFRNEVEQYETPAADRRPLTDVAREEKFQEILRRVRRYCLDRSNAEDMQRTCFGGRDNATAQTAPDRYNRWYEEFGRRVGDNNAE